MDKKTYMDMIVTYPSMILREIGQDETIAKLITNNPNLSMDSDEADDIFDRYLFDYGYVDETTQEARAYICVEAEAMKQPGIEIVTMGIYIDVFCHKDFMDIDPKLFPGFVGNRKDNIVRYIDKIMQRENFVGIGVPEMTSIKSIPAPVGFTARELTYKAPDFRRPALS